MPELVNGKPRIAVIGIGGAGGNAVNNMIAAGLGSVKFIVANTDMQALSASKAEHRIQLGTTLTEGLGAGARPEIGEGAAEEALDEILAHISDCHMLFIAAGMGGGTGTGAAYVVARAARQRDILTIAVVTKPFSFEGAHRMRNAEAGIAALGPNVDTMLVIPNENLFRVANDKTTFAEAFLVADQVLYSGIACLVDLIVEEGLINLDLADVRTILGGMGCAMMGTGEAAGDQRAIAAAEEAVVNPLLDNVTLKGAKSLLLSITGGRDLTLWEVDEAANRVRQEVDADANIIVGATLNEQLGDKVRVSIVASGMPASAPIEPATEAEAPMWVPRAMLAPQRPAVGPETYGHRLTEAIAERGGGKGRKAPKGRPRARGKAAKDRIEGADPAVPAVASVATMAAQQPRRTRRPPASTGEWTPGRAGLDQSEAPPPRRRLPPQVQQPQPPAVQESAGLGWPEHWAAAASESDVQSTPPRQIEGQSAHGGEAEPTQKSTLFRRLAGLMGAKRAV